MSLTGSRAADQRKRGRTGVLSKCKGPVPGEIPLAILTPDNRGTGDPKTGRLTGNFVHQDEGSKSPLCKCSSSTAEGPSLPGYRLIYRSIPKRKVRPISVFSDCDSNFGEVPKILSRFYSPTETTYICLLRLTLNMALVY